MPDHAPKDRKWRVPAEPTFIGEDGDVYLNAIDGSEVEGALLELAPMLYRLGGAVVVSADRTLVDGEFRTIGLVVAYRSFVPPSTVGQQARPPSQAAGVTREQAQAIADELNGNVAVDDLFEPEDPTGRESAAMRDAIEEEVAAREAAENERPPAPPQAPKVPQGADEEVETEEGFAALMGVAPALDDEPLDEEPVSAVEDEVLIPSPDAATVAGAPPRQRG
jgi:hypothetical protein